MSVIDVKGRTTSSHEDFDSNKASDRSLILIEQSTNVESFSIELTLGASWSERYSNAANGMFGIPTEGIVLKPSSSVVVEVAETITVPFNMYGLVIPTGSLFLDRGIIIAAAKIEPSFSGKLKLRLVNTTGERHRLTPGLKVASAIFYSTEQTRPHPPVQKRVAPSVPQPPLWRRTCKWIVKNPDKVFGWIVQILVSTMAVFLVTQFLISKPQPESTAIVKKKN
ncbi:hypothetical protein MZO42_13665 [Sphingomonas psychrotolerans]|uniref:dUTPase-like domain-containing protein n=1 Tax=Sphingomonas psychrotolerans TaxID=1327635 RepID=A0ABU3N5E1_9SPHN|nr:hypothetical protein [Sphingomonas psychrotolerans]MDT8759745.1 hypothetical protein [Sphingomonas psychrotolerans]